MRWGAERKIVSVDFEAARRILGKPEIAENFAFDAFEDPGGAAVPSIRHAAERARGIKTLRDEADAGQLLRRPAEVLPEAALLARCGEVIFAGPRLPGAHPGIELADLHAPWLVVAVADAPIMPLPPR
jgi:hypothetical protein